MSAQNDEKNSLALSNRSKNYLFFLLFFILLLLNGTSLVLFAKVDMSFNQTRAGVTFLIFNTNISHSLPISSVPFNTYSAL